MSPSEALPWIGLALAIQSGIIAPVVGWAFNATMKLKLMAAEIAHLKEKRAEDTARVDKLEKRQDEILEELRNEFREFRQDQGKILVRIERIDTQLQGVLEDRG